MIYGPGGPFQPPSSTATKEPRCYECNDTGFTQLHHLKLLHGPKLHPIAIVNDLCPYCHPES